MTTLDLDANLLTALVAEVHELRRQVAAANSHIEGLKLKLGDHARVSGKVSAEVRRLREALWDFVDVASCVGPVQSGSAVWHHAKKVLGERRPDELHGREK